MLLLIVGGIVYAVLTESLVVSILTASLILYRAQRPSQFRRRFNDARYARQAARIGE